MGGDLTRPPCAFELARAEAARDIGASGRDVSISLACLAVIFLNVFLRFASRVSVSRYRQENRETPLLWQARRRALPSPRVCRGQRTSNLAAPPRVGLMQCRPPLRMPECVPTRCLQVLPRAVRVRNWLPGATSVRHALARFLASAPRNAPAASANSGGTCVHATHRGGMACHDDQGNRASRKAALGCHRSFLQRGSMHRVAPKYVRQRRILQERYLSDDRQIEDRDRPVGKLLENCPSRGRHAASRNSSAR